MRHEGERQWASGDLSIDVSSGNMMLVSRWYSVKMSSRMGTQVIAD